MIKYLSKFYSNDVDKEDIQKEMILWCTHLEKMSVHGVLNALDKCNKNLLLNMFKPLHSFATLPVISCKSEISFSTLYRIKTYIRNFVGQLKINGLTSSNIHCEVKVTIEDCETYIVIKSKTSNRFYFIIHYYIIRGLSS